MGVNPTFGGGAPGEETGVNAIPPYGQREQVLFGGTWLPGDIYQILAQATNGALTLGAGAFSTTANNLPVAIVPTVCFTYRERVYLGFGSEFAFSDNELPTMFEEQSPGAGNVPYLSQYGGQDTVVAFSQMQGRLAVFAKQSIQIWVADADPANFSLVQTLDNAGTPAPLSVQSIGDYDVLYLDRTGFRSLRAKEVTLNAFVDDAISSPIDTFIQTLTQAGLDLSGACAITDPQTKNYWCYVQGTIYVLARSLGAKLQAWSTYIPTDNSGVRFTPQKFVIYNGQIYCRGVEGGMYAYGGLNAAQFDSTVATISTPFYDDKKADIMKFVQAIQVVAQGQWTISMSTDPNTGGNPARYHQVWQNPATLNPGELIDSSYDDGVVPVQMKGTHFAFQMQTSQPGDAVFSSITLHYNVGEDVS